MNTLPTGSKSRFYDIVLLVFLNQSYSYSGPILGSESGSEFLKERFCQCSAQGRSVLPKTMSKVPEIPRMSRTFSKLKTVNRFRNKKYLFSKLHGFKHSNRAPKTISVHKMIKINIITCDRYLPRRPKKNRDSRDFQWVGHLGPDCETTLTVKRMHFVFRWNSNGKFSSI